MRPSGDLKVAPKTSLSIDRALARNRFGLLVVTILQHDCRIPAAGEAARAGRPRKGKTRVAEETIGNFQADLLAREITVRAAAEAYLERIERLDRNGPALNSVIEVNPDAL